MAAIVWIRRAMRVHDNTALVEAAADHDEVVPVYVVDEDYFEHADLGYPRVRFWHECLQDLQEQLQDHGAELIVREGKPIEQLQQVIAETGADVVHHNRDYEPYARERDQQAQDELDVPVRTHKDTVMFEKEEILTNSGTPYKVYSYYRDKWFDREKPRPAAPNTFSVPDVRSDAVPSLEELGWRDFYYQVLWNWPESADAAFLEQYRSIDWHWDDAHEGLWEAFLAGETGYPFVDAGMRQLRRTGWMHNRLRMVVTSFAAKDLHVDWRKLHEYFNRWFIDAEISAMVGGIQWAYSIGTDAQPYFRVFNPWTQGEKYDPDGDFIREQVPELADVPDEYIHRPYQMPEDVQQEASCIIGEDYPAPIVDHDEARETAVALFEDARDKD